MRTRSAIALMGGLLLAAVLATLPATAEMPPTVEDLKAQAKLALDGEGLAAPGGSVAAGATSTTGRPPRVGANVQVSQNQDPGAAFRSGASELSIAITDNGNKVIVGWNDGEGFGFAPFSPGPPLGLSGYGYSTDAGVTFTDGGAPPIGNVIAFGPGTEGRSATGNYVTRGDPWLDVGGPDNDVFYFANLAVWEDDAALPTAGVSIHDGSFTGETFSWNSPRLIQSPNYPNDFLDKEALAVTRVEDADVLDVSLTNFIERCNVPFFGFGQIELYRSADSGASWSRTIVQADESFVTDASDPLCGLDGIINQGSMPAIGTDGEVYIAWERGWLAPLVGGSELPRASIVVATSTDGGATFGDPVEVASICSGALSPPAAYNRTQMNDFPRIAVAETGPHRGRVYVTYQDCSAASGAAPFGSDTDAYVAHSDDGGATWSTPTPVHAVADGLQQMWPVVSVDSTGNVDVTYYSMKDVNVTDDPDDIECSVRIGGPLDSPTLRESTVTTFSDVYWTQSTDGGVTWKTPVRVTDTSTNWCAATPLNSIIPNFGDYNTSVSHGNKVFAAWADGRNGGFVDRVATAYFARIKAIGRAPR